jgi:TPR repeat protein
MKRGVHALLLGLCLLLTQAALALADPLGDGLVAYATGDYATAWRVLRPWAEQGNPDALTAVGVMYVKGQGVDRDYTQALDLFNRAISAGSEDAEAELGYMYGSGYGVPQDYEEAVSKYRDSIQKGSVRGENYLGEAYVAGQGVVKDYDQARQLFEDAARKSLPVALANLGNLYYLGRGVPKDLGTALRYYEAAAAKNSPEAQNNLGLMYQKGIGVPQDPAQALELFKRAALLGESSGAYNAGWAFENGIGVPQDFLQAYEWYDIGAHDGGTFSSRRRDLIATQLTADQIEQATQAETATVSGGTATSPSEQSSATSAKTNDAPTQTASQTYIAPQQEGGATSDSADAPMQFTMAANGGNCARCEWINATGVIDSDTPSRFQKYVDDEKTKWGFVDQLVVLNSPGGDLWAAIKLGRLLRQHGMTTEVGETYRPAGSKFEQLRAGVCASACAYSYFGGATPQPAQKPQNSAILRVLAPPVPPAPPTNSIQVSASAPVTPATAQARGLGCGDRERRPPIRPRLPAAPGRALRFRGVPDAARTPGGPGLSDHAEGQGRARRAGCPRLQALRPIRYGIPRPAVCSRARSAAACRRGRRRARSRNPSRRGRSPGCRGGSRAAGS